MWSHNTVVDCITDNFRTWLLYIFKPNDYKCSLVLICSVFGGLVDVWQTGKDYFFIEGSSGTFQGDDEESLVSKWDEHNVIMQERKWELLTCFIMYNSVKNSPTSYFVIWPVISLDITCLCSQCIVSVYVAARSGAKGSLWHHACCCADKWDRKLSYVLIFWTLLVVGGDRNSCTVARERSL